MKKDIDNRPRSDCFHFRGEVPCIKKKVCWECNEFEEIPKRALVIKFGAAGDALRTTPILSRLRRDGFKCITWICDEASREVLSFAKNIDKLVVFGTDALLKVAVEKYDAVFSFDKNLSAAALAVVAKSEDKRGFGATESGKLFEFNEESLYALKLGIDNNLKFKLNIKSVPELIFEMAGYKYNGEEYEFELKSKIRRKKNVVALNIGVGKRWPTKSWPDDCWVKLAVLLKKSGFKPVFVGGEAERSLLSNYSARAEVEFLPPSELHIFAEALAAAGTVVTCDSLALHIALAVKTRVIGLFCSTCSNEIEWFNRGEALISKKGPCYDSHCCNWPDCMRSISPESVLKKIMKS